MSTTTGGVKKLRSESATSQEGMKKGTWSEDEHERLAQAVLEYGTDGSVAWTNIQQYVGTRDIKQCKDRYKLKLDESFTSSEWTKSEDQILMNCVDTYGQRWTKIAQELPGRNENSIKTRYHTLQRRELKVWTPEEENLLKNLLARQVSFEDICQCFPRKTPNMIATRRDYLAMEVTAESIKQQMRATSPDDINSTLLQPFTTTPEELAILQQQQQDNAVLFPQYQSTVPAPAAAAAPPPPPFESPSSRRFRFTRKSSERVDGSYSPLQFGDYRTSTDMLGLSPLDESFLSILQKMSNKESGESSSNNNNNNAVELDKMEEEEELSVPFTSPPANRNLRMELVEEEASSGAFRGLDFE